MSVICLEDDAFFALIETVVERLKSDNEPKAPRDMGNWVSSKDAMDLLGISSPNTLQKYRNEGWIEFTQLSANKILYDRRSIAKYLEKKKQRRL
ncbi:MAG: helix-turn-helix domain-containing protein [Bacteroidia bacterium]|nr:helix-turn-helix domain-containing protein [Bacteroidia bacterium]